jgi:hypothetical protein
VFADPGRKHARCSPEVAPLVGGTALLALIFVYTGAHAVYYGPSEAAVVPLMSGAALLTVGLLCLRPELIAGRVSPVRAPSVMRIAGPGRKWDKQEGANILALDRPRQVAIARPMTRYESFVARLQSASPPQDPVAPTRASGSES